jgi:hypothetical protein
MVQAPSDSSSSLSNMALLSLSDLVLNDNITITNLGFRNDGNPLLAPLYKGNKIVLNLTPGDDDWLEVMDVNSTPMDHHSGEAAQALHIAVCLAGSSAANAPVLDQLDKMLQKEVGYSVTKSKKAWYSTHRGNGKIILNLAVDNTAAPTALRFFKNGRFEKGHGKEFLQTSLAGGNLKDFRCKAKAELECIQENDDGFTVLITAHSVMFVPVPKRNVVDYNDVEEKAAIQAAKRLKYRF